MGPKSTSLTYNEGAGSKGRVYILYTGEHYDAVVSAATKVCLRTKWTMMRTALRTDPRTRGVVLHLSKSKTLTLNQDALPEVETRVHSGDTAPLDAKVLALADSLFQEDLKRASIRVKKLLCVPHGGILVLVVWLWCGCGGCCVCSCGWLTPAQFPFPPTFCLRAFAYCQQMWRLRSPMQ